MLLKNIRNHSFSIQKTYTFASFFFGDYRLWVNSAHIGLI
ncbi:hypothetical protein TFKS16_0451 [Tannerella forsythia KS16]|uniref:Uncharacterized protein n=1 Tax=Tannerella forsythia (strain ATCC 43037 / JCM 10827 / CCUG 21028 A / KCTC 5666 / FDC 338) TaxID=203275 RepID=G8UKZ6_TANFA|nr:hypothetical protein BFO_0488 [Tannerella forsythia 92A2]BAR50764.1 hypothetical protein TFKS16_0451 [Tannerella forsythia KS16]